MFQTTYDNQRREDKYPHAQDPNFVALDRDKDSYKIQGPMGSQAHPSGIFIMSASGTPSIPMYLTSQMPVAVSVDIESDSIKVFSASGTPTIPVYNTNPVEVIVDIGDAIKIMSASGTSDIPVYLQSDLDKNNDSVTVYNVSSSGTPVIPVYVDGGFVDTDIDESTDSIRVYSASGTAAIETYIGNDVAIHGTVTATVDTSLLATASNQIDGTQQTRITDGTDIAQITGDGEIKVNQSGVTTLAVPVLVENGAGEEIPVSGYITAHVDNFSALDKSTDSVSVWSASGTASIPVYNTSPMEVVVDIGDSIKIVSASGTSDIPVYLQSNLDYRNDSVTATVVSASGTSVLPVYLEGGNASVSTDESVNSIRIYSTSGTSDIPIYASDPIQIMSSSGTPPIPIYSMDPIEIDGAVDVNTVPADYDYTEITYDANQNPLTIVYKIRGAGGTTVMTATMTYDANQNLETRMIS